MRNALLAGLALSLLAVPLATAQQAATPAAVDPQGNVSQNATKPLTFDVISVKPNHSGSADAWMGMNRDGFTAANIDLHLLLLQAFELQEGDQLLGEPKWTTGDRWDIDARIAAEDIPALAKMTYHERNGMFREILVERFGLKVHHETRTLPVYALVVAKGGPKMTASKPQPNDPDGMPGNPGVLNTSLGKETEIGRAHV